MGVVTHVCNPSYSGGGSQSKVVKQTYEILFEKQTKRTGGMTQAGGPEFKPTIEEKKEKKKTPNIL
jgi:hypothetical protein